jgi:hypothetical protein
MQLLGWPVNVLMPACLLLRYVPELCCKLLQSWAPTSATVLLTVPSVDKLQLLLYQSAMIKAWVMYMLPRSIHDSDHGSRRLRMACAGSTAECSSRAGGRGYLNLLAVYESQD